HPRHLMSLHFSSASFMFSLMILTFFFFFSSRRRHTRWPRDWSSDVCSSDLLALRNQRVADDVAPLARPVGKMADASIELPRTVRSEERRVGKECRSRWSRYH